MGAYQDKQNAIAEAQAMADQQMGYTQTPYAYEAPESFVVEGAIFTPFTSPASQPFNPNDVGIVPFISNAYKSASEILLQQKPANPLPPSFTYEGPVGGAGFLGLFPPAPGSKEYNEFIAKQKAKDEEHYNNENVGIAPRANNEKCTAEEINNQTVGPNFWERLIGAIQQGYNKEPEDVNTFTKSVDQLGAAALGMAKPTNYVIIAIAGVVLLVLLIK